MRPSQPIGSGIHDAKIMEFIDDFWRTQFHPPTIREIRVACGVSSTSVVAYTLHRFVASGRYILCGGIVPLWVVNAIKGKHG